MQQFSNYKHLNLEFCNIKVLFFSNFISNFGFFLKFAKNNNYQFIDTMLYFRFVSSDVSNCIVLKFMCAKFQVSSSKKQGSYWCLNMGHLLKITLYKLFVGKFRNSMVEGLNVNFYGLGSKQSTLQNINQTLDLWKRFCVIQP